MLSVGPELWIVGVLVTILIAVLGVLGGLIKVTYDLTKQLRTTLYGDPEADIDGFLHQAREHHQELEDDHEQVYNQLLIQGRLLSELTYAFADIAEDLNANDNVDIDVNLDRIEDLRERKDDDRRSD